MSEKAREYLRLKERLKQAEMTAFCRDAARIAKETEMLFAGGGDRRSSLHKALPKATGKKTQALPSERK